MYLVSHVSINNSWRNCIYPNSVFSYYKRLIALRKDPAYLDSVIYGSMVPYREEQKNLMAFYRKGETQTLLILCNFQKDPQNVPLPSRNYQILINNLPTFSEAEGTVHLAGYQAVVLKL